MENSRRGPEEDDGDDGGEDRSLLLSLVVIHAILLSVGVAMFIDIRFNAAEWVFQAGDHFQLIRYTFQTGARRLFDWFKGRFPSSK